MHLLPRVPNVSEVLCSIWLFVASSYWTRNSTRDDDKPSVKGPRISKKPQLNVVIEGKQKELVVGQTIKPDLLPVKKLAIFS